MITDATYDIPISIIKRDKKLILEYHVRKESARELHRHSMESKERVDAVKTIINLIDKWNVEPNEIFGCQIFHESWDNEMEEPYGPVYHEKALDYSIVIHDVFDIDYKCKECANKPTCCRFSNFDKFENNAECDGISQLLNATIIKDIEDYYKDEAEKYLDTYLDGYLLGW